MSAAICLPADQDERALDQWSYVLSHWHVEPLMVLGDIPSAWWPVIPFRNAVSVPDLHALPGRVVVAAPRHGRYHSGEQSLVDYSHPDTATYVFGSDHRYLTPDMLPAECDSVYIPTVSAVDMYSWVAAAVFLYDRAVKRG